MVKFGCVNHLLHRISAGLTFTVEKVLLQQCSERVIRVLKPGGRSLCASVRGHAALLWKHTVVKNTTSCETSATTHTNTYVQIAAGLGLAFVVFSWLHGEFTLSLWYYPIQPVWPLGNPLFSLRII